MCRIIVSQKEDRQRLVCCIMGQDCERLIGMSLKSVKDADAIVYCDGGSMDNTLVYLKNNGFKYDIDDNKKDKIIISQLYDQNDKTMNGRQRNFYLDYVKKNYPDYWCLAIDADEVVEDLSQIKKLINNISEDDKIGCLSVKMRHLIGDLAHEDAVTPEHWVPNRLFKVWRADKYTEVEHSVLAPKKSFGVGRTDITTIWHLAYCPNMWEIKKRYDNHMAKSDMHTPEYLRQWRNAHLFGTYPKKAFNPVELPDIILNEFGIDKDELYFANRGVEMKHFLMVKQWYDLFDEQIDTFEVLDFGAGRGPFGYVWEYLNQDYLGVELSQYAVDNKLCKSLIQGNVLNYKARYPYRLVTAIDLLEHLEYEDLDKAIDNLIHNSNRYILVSVPVIGDPNLEADPTHIIKESKEWWINQFTKKKLKLVETPEDWLFKDQLMIFEK